MTANKTLMLAQFTLQELKDELQRRKVLERAKLHLPSAEASLAKAQAKVHAYRKAMAEHEELTTPVRSDDLIGQIKALRTKTGAGLRDAKNAVEKFRGDAEKQAAYILEMGQGS